MEKMGLLHINESVDGTTARGCCPLEKLFWHISHGKALNVLLLEHWIRGPRRACSSATAP